MVRDLNATVASRGAVAGERLLEGSPSKIDLDAAGAAPCACYSRWEYLRCFRAGRRRSARVCPGSPGVTVRSGKNGGVVQV